MLHVPLSSKNNWHTEPNATTTQPSVSHPSAPPRSLPLIPAPCDQVRRVPVAQRPLLLYLGSDGLEVFREGGPPRGFKQIVSDRSPEVFMKHWAILGLSCEYTVRVSHALLGLRPIGWWLDGLGSDTDSFAPTLSTDFVAAAISSPQRCQGGQYLEDQKLLDTASPRDGIRRSIPKDVCFPSWSKNGCFMGFWFGG